MSENKSKVYLKTFQQLSNAESIVDELHYKELEHKFQTLLGQLSPRQKEIYHLSREESLSHKDIAAKLGISENTVKNHMVTTLKFLRTKFGNSLPISVLFLSLFA